VVVTDPTPPGHVTATAGRFGMLATKLLRRRPVGLGGKRGVVVFFRVNRWLPAWEWSLGPQIGVLRNTTVTGSPVDVNSSARYMLGLAGMAVWRFG